MKAFAHERCGDWEGAAAAYDAALALDTRSPALWNAKGLSLVHLRRFDEAGKCFDLALSIDPNYAAAVDAKKLCEERAATATVEAFARAVVQYELAVQRPASKEEIFKECGVPLQLLDNVVSYVNEPAAIAVESLPPDQLKRFEDASLAILRGPSGKDLRLSDVVGTLPNLDVSEAREVLGYLKGVRSLRLEPDPSWHMDPLIRKALDLPKEAWTLRGLARELNIGPYEAKKLEVSLKIFEGGGYRVKTEVPPGAEKPRVPQRVPAKEAPVHTTKEDAEASEALSPPKPRAPPEGPEARPAPVATETPPAPERPKKREDADASRDFSRL